MFWYQNKTYRHSCLIYFERNNKYNFPNWFLKWWDFCGPIEEILPSPAKEGFKLFKIKYDQDSIIPTDLQFYSKFSLAWVFSWQYKFGKKEHPNILLILQRNSYVKWWIQFEASKASLEEVRKWSLTNSEFLKLADPKSSLFLNHKAQITAALTASKSKESFAKNLQNILNLLKDDEGTSLKKSLSSSSASTASSDDMFQNEDDCFEINLAED